jgi:ribosome-associated translation inhibitor RaiA
VAFPATLPEVTLEGDFSPEATEAIRQRFASLQRFTSHPLTGMRLTLRPIKGSAKRPWAADASLLYGKDRRVLAAHVTARDALEALDRVFERLRKQIRRVETADRDAARRELDFDVTYRPEARLKPPEERQIVRHRTFADAPVGTIEAVDDLLSMDLEFLLFRHARTGEDVVVYRRDDGRIGLIHPQGSELADENDVVVPEPSRYSEALSVEQARQEMDVLNHRFLYFIAAEDLRGRVIYLRDDGDYGLVEPE